jgi:hypothetical protein
MLHAVAAHREWWDIIPHVYNSLACALETVVGPVGGVVLCECANLSKYFGNIALLHQVLTHRCDAACCSNPPQVVGYHPPSI